jgi:hypothetical protein
MNLVVAKSLNRQFTEINPNNLKLSAVNQVHGLKSKKSAIDDVEKLKQRREERKKKKNDEDKKTKLDNLNQDGMIKAYDQDFENLIKKKRQVLVLNPDQVRNSKFYII